MTERHVPSKPYPWPYNGDLRAENTSLLVIDMQIDFLGEGGFIDRIGFDYTQARVCIEPIQRVLEAMRRAGFHVIHTREGHRPDLYDLPPNKQWRSRKIGAAIGECGPCGHKPLTRGEKTWDIIPEVYPHPGEPIIDKPGKGAFYATDLESILRQRGITNLVLTGVTTDVCVTTTMREANDRGFECLLLEDCCAATDPESHEHIIQMTRKKAVFGTAAPSSALLEVIGRFDWGRP
jgi:nicotinamidase-related amidase